MTPIDDPASPSGALPGLLALQAASLLLRIAQSLLVAAGAALPPEADATADAALLQACAAAQTALARMWRAHLALRHLRPGLARTRRAQDEAYRAEAEWQFHLASVTMLWAWTARGLAGKAGVLRALLDDHGPQDADLRRVAVSLVNDIQRLAWTGYGADQ